MDARKRSTSSMTTQHQTNPSPQEALRDGKNTSSSAHTRRVYVRNRQQRQEPVVDNERAERLLQQQKQPVPSVPVAWGYGRFGIRWTTSIDMMNVPDTAGVFVLFFAQKRKIVGTADNLFRAIQQYWYAPGPSVLAFSWLEIIPPEGSTDAQRSLQSCSYEQLWDDLRFPTGEPQETD